MSLKKGDFNTPPVNPFLKKENGGFDPYFKTAARLSVFCWAHERSAAKQRFFLLLQGGKTRHKGS